VAWIMLGFILSFCIRMPPATNELLEKWAHEQYIAKHYQDPSQQWGNFYYFRMQNI
ncbi:hypothetical protein Droror1_Dr00017664, partial [Drosera rotundifolia]